MPDTLEKTLPQTSPPPDSPQDTPSETTSTELSEKETAQTKKTSFLSRFTSIDKKEDIAQKSHAFDSNSDGYISAREAINALDTGVSVEKLSDEEVLAQKVHSQLKEEADYFVFRFRKSRTLLTFGVALLLLWLLPMTLFLSDRYNFTFMSLFADSKVTKVPESVLITPTSSPIPTLPRIRVKGDLTTSTTTTVVDLLSRSGYLVDTFQATPETTGVSIAFREPASAEAQAILLLLAQNYNATSSAVFLTEDSDVDAVVFVAN